MWDAFALLLGLRAIALSAREGGARVVPEPEFKPFVFSKKSAASDLSAANSTHHPRTLVELGIPASYAAELEATFRAMGAVEGDRVVGFTFRAADGASYPLRTASPQGAGARAGRAA